MAETNDFATYEECMAYTSDLDTDIRKVRGLLMAFGLEKRIRIAYDEWNLRGWHHPGVLSIQQAISEEDYLLPRNLNDRNCDYTMADAVFTACFLNTLCRNCDIIGMANFSPAVNTRGCIYTYPGGIVLRSTYHVFDLYTNALGKEILDCTLEGVGQLTCRGKDGVTQTVPALDALCTRRRSDNFLAVALVNKHPESTCSVRLDWPARAFRLITVSGESTEAYNDVDRTMVSCTDTPWMPCDSAFAVTLPPHSVSVVQLRTA